MTADEHRQQRERMHRALQDVVADTEQGALVGGWFLVAELHAPGGGTYLAYRSSDLNGDGLKSWTALGYLHSAVQGVEQQCWDTTIPADDDEA